MANSQSPVQERRFDAGGPTLADTGEAEIVRLLATIVRETGAGAGLELGPGDDAALWVPTPGRRLAVSQDAIVEGQDFRRGWTTPRALGSRALAVALSDLAAMGARPALCLASLCAPSTTCLEDVLELQRGLCLAARDLGCAVAGGDVSATEGPLLLDICVVGELERGRSLRRDSGRPGEQVLLTGVVGRAAAGLELLRDPSLQAAVAGDEMRRWLEAQLSPRPRLAEGLRLAASGVRCGGDVSDGILAELERITTASSCGAELWLDAVPVDAGLRPAFGERWPELALGSGEDFELLVTAEQELAAKLIDGWAAELAPLTTIGRLVPGSGTRLLASRGGPELPLPAIRSRHFGAGTRP